MTIAAHGPGRSSEPIYPSGPEGSPQSREPNRLLRVLPPDSYERLSPHLERVEFSVRQTLWETNAPIRSVYFPRTCVLSLLIPLEEDGPVESATIGREGMAGVPIVLGADETLATTIAQVPGEALRLPAAVLRTAIGQDSALLAVMLRYAHVLHEQASQAVACNRKHSMDERCARWLLMTQDRVGASQFPLTQEFLAFMLGVRRATVTVAAGILQHAGLIRYSRGKVTIVDRARLEEAACGCYRVMREKSEAMFGPEAAW
jgi:CRP-like cAMP-binding protein